MPITALPTPPSRQDPANFAARGDALLAALPAFQVEANVLQADVNAKQLLAAANALAAQADRLLCAAVAANPAVINGAAYASTAQAAATAAAISASLAQATNPGSPVRINPCAISADFTLASAYNAQSTGPMRINDGVTVTVQDNATWAVN